MGKLSRVHYSTRVPVLADTGGYPLVPRPDRKHGHALAMFHTPPIMPTLSAESHTFEPVLKHWYQLDRNSMEIRDI